MKTTMMKGMRELLITHPMKQLERLMRAR